MPTQELVRELFDYKDGTLYIRKHVFRSYRKIGSAVGYLNNGRYLYACIGKKQYPVHRLIWVWHNGPISKGHLLDHIDHDSLNNRIENLRLATAVQNGRNRTLTRNSPSGHLGVRFRNGKWHASIGLGAYDTLEEAIAIRKAAEQLAGFHPNHGKEKPRLPVA